MKLVLTALALTVLAGPATAQEPPPPDPLENLVPTPNPAVGSIQVDLGFYTSWQKGVRAKFEGKFPGPAPRLPDGKPDLSGTWIASEKLTRPQATPAALAELDRRFRTNLKDFPYSVCLPPLPAQATNAGGLWEVLHTQARLAVLFLSPPHQRLVYLDGRPHPPDPDPTWMGHSVGRWDGDTLVIETTGFNDRSWLEGSLPHTEKLRMVERWTRPTMGSLVVERTYEDPDVFVTPWTISFTAFLAPGEELQESLCENNRFKGR